MGWGGGKGAGAGVVSMMSGGGAREGGECGAMAGGLGGTSTIPNAGQHASGGGAEGTDDMIGETGGNRSTGGTDLWAWRRDGPCGGQDARWGEGEGGGWQAAF